MTKGERIRSLREKLNKSQVEIADSIGVSKQTLYKYENDIITNIPSDKIEELARELNTTPSYLMGWEESPSSIRTIEKNADTLLIPVYAYVSAGPGSFADDSNIECYIEIPKEWAKHGEFFGLRVKGDSMEPDLRDQDIVVVKRIETVSPEMDNKIVVAIVNGDEGFVKRLAMYADGMNLLPNNPAHRPMYFTANEVRSLPVRIVGIVQRLIRDL